MAAVRQLTGGGYLVRVSETELALISTALEQTERVLRFGIEVLHGTDQNRQDGRPQNTRLGREIDVLAMREASVKALQETIAQGEPSEQVA